MENKTGKYFKYAIGEILLVVIGILIALQINNWNENRKAQKAQNSLLINLYDNLAADSIIIQQNNKYHMLKIIETQKQLHAFRKNLIKPGDIDNPQNIRGSIRIYSITKTNHPDIATKVFKESLKEQIREYYRLLSFLENAYTQYDNVVKQTIRPHLADNLALNPDFIFDNQGQNDNRNELNLEQFYLIVKKDEFGQILFESNLKANEMVTFFDEILTANSALRLALKNEIKF